MSEFCLCGFRKYLFTKWFTLGENLPIGGGKGRMEPGMDIKIQSTNSHILGMQLDEFEQKYEMPSDRFIEAFQNGRLRETDDFWDWSHTYKAFQLTSRQR